MGDIGSIFIAITATDEDNASANATFSTAIHEQLVSITVAAFLSAPAQRTVFAGGAGLQEFAFGTAADPGGSGQLQILRDSQAQKMYLTYQRRMNDPWLSFAIEASPDLVQWSSASAHVYPIRAFPVTDDFERVILFVNPDFAAQNRFFRVKTNWGD